MSAQFLGVLLRRVSLDARLSANMGFLSRSRGIVPVNWHWKGFSVLNTSKNALFYLVIVSPQIENGSRRRDGVEDGVRRASANISVNIPLLLHD